MRGKNAPPSAPQIPDMRRKGCDWRKAQAASLASCRYDTFSMAGKSIQKAPCKAAPLDSGDYLAHFSGRGGRFPASAGTSAAQLKNVPLACVLA